MPEEQVNTAKPLVQAPVKKDGDELPKTQLNPKGPAVVINPGRSKMDELVENKDVEFIRNTKGPENCYIRLERKDGKVVKFHTHYPAKVVQETNDSKSSLANSKSVNWVAVSKEDVAKIEEAKKKIIPAKSLLEQQRENVAKLDPKKGIREVNPTKVETKVIVEGVGGLTQKEKEAQEKAKDAKTPVGATNENPNPTPNPTPVPVKTEIPADKK